MSNNPNLETTNVPVKKRQYGRPKGYKHSEESKAKMRKNHNYEQSNKPHTEETKKKMSERFKADYACGKRKPALLGTKQTKEFIKKRFDARAGYVHSEETKHKIGKANSIALIGRKLTPEQCELISKRMKILANTPEWKERVRSYMTGENNPTKRPEVRQKLRLATIKKIEAAIGAGGQMAPFYNPRGCQYFNKLMKEQKIHIQHAENGGEFHIKELGYWVDGYDKENNIVYEWDEKQHFNSDGSYTERDVRRQKEIEELLGCKFVRIKDRKEL